MKLAERLAGVDLALGRALAIDGRVIDRSDEPMADVNVMAIPDDGRGVPSAIA